MALQQRQQQEREEGQEQPVGVQMGQGQGSSSSKEQALTHAGGRRGSGLKKMTQAVRGRLCWQHTSWG